MQIEACLLQTNLWCAEKHRGSMRACQGHVQRGHDKENDKKLGPRGVGGFSQVKGFRGESRPGRGRSLFPPEEGGNVQHISGNKKGW